MKTALCSISVIIGDTLVTKPPWMFSRVIKKLFVDDVSKKLLVFNCDYWMILDGWYWNSFKGLLSTRDAWKVNQSAQRIFPCRPIAWFPALPPGTRFPALSVHVGTSFYFQSWLVCDPVASLYTMYKVGSRITSGWRLNPCYCLLLFYMLGQLPGYLQPASERWRSR